MKIKSIFVKDIGEQFIDKSEIKTLEFFYCQTTDIYQIRNIKNKKPVIEYRGEHVIYITYEQELHHSKEEYEG
jgi:hypothetical protein